MPSNDINNERELLQQMAEGDDRAFEQIYKLFFTRLSYYAFKITGDAEQSKDIASGALLRIYNPPRSFETLTHVRNYLYLATRHASLHFLEQQRREQHAYREFMYIADEETPTIDLERIRTEIIAEIRRQLQELPKGCAAVFDLIYFQGKSVTEVANELNISSKTVLNQKQTALKLLKSILLKKGLFSLLAWLISEF